MAPDWVKEALEQGDHMQHIKPENQVRIFTPTRGQASSSSWEGPITDSQAVVVSDYLLTEQEAAQYHSEDGEEEPDINQRGEQAYEEAQDLGTGPSWEMEIPPRMKSIEYPRNMGAYARSGEDAYEAYWKAWLEEVIEPPTSDTAYL